MSFPGNFTIYSEISAFEINLKKINKKIWLNLVSRKTESLGGKY